MKMSFIKLI